MALTGPLQVGKGFHNARADIAPERTFVVHAGEDRYPMPDGIEVVGLRGLCGEIAALSS